MANKQYYSIQYPFKSDNDENHYIDINDSYLEGIKSQILHILFTPKGQRLRDPNFGTDLIKYLFSPSDGTTFNEIKATIREDINAYIPNVIFGDISILKDENEEHSSIVNIQYKVKVGIKEIDSNVAVKI